MDSSELSWLSELGFDDNSILMDEWELMDSFDDDVAALLGSQNSPISPSTLINTTNCNSFITSVFSPESPPPPPPLSEPPPKLHKPNTFSTFTTHPNSTAPIILNFQNTTEVDTMARPVLNPEEGAAVTEVLRGDQDEQPKRPQTSKKPSRVRPPSQTYDHIIAERKRRELLSQRFLTLSTIIPGLKKMDKTSVLGDAIKYLKHLQERVKTLEEQATKQTMESVVLVKRSHVMAEDEGSSNDKSCCFDELPLPEIEARVSNNLVLLRVHCEKHKGVLVNLLSKVEKLNLAIISTNVTPFGTFALDITIVAEMEKDFNLTVKEVVKRLRAAL